MADLSFVHATNEGGKDFYYVFDGHLNYRDAGVAVRRRQKIEGTDHGDTLYVEHIERVST